MKLALLKELGANWDAMDADQIIAFLEQLGYGWSLDNTGRFAECRIWDWPHVVGRYRPHKTEPLADMLRGAIARPE